MSKHKPSSPPQDNLFDEGASGSGAGAGLLRIVSPDDDASDYEVLRYPEAGPDPAGLFLSDELLVPHALTDYRKPVAAIHAIPESREATLTLSARKLMEALPLAVQLDLRARRKDEAQELVRKIREDRATPLFEIRTRELARLAGLSLTNLDRVHELLADLVGLKFAWNVLHEDGQAEYETVAAFLIRRDKGVGTKYGYTRFAFEPEILLWFLEPQMWAKLSWSVMSSLGGRGNGPGQEAAFGLYQNIWRYLGTHQKLTPAHDTATWIDFILGPSRFVQVDAAGKKTVVDYKDFKRRYLLPGLAVLNEHQALSHTADYVETFSGRKVVKLRFKFTAKRQPVCDSPIGWPEPMLKQLRDVGLTDADLATLSQLYSHHLVAEALKRLPAAEQRIRTAGSAVYSRKGFFTGILNNVAKGDAQSTEDEDKALKAAEHQQLKDDEAARMQQMQEKFGAHQRAIVVPVLLALPAAQLDRLYKEHLAADPGAKVLFKATPPGKAYLTSFVQWFAKAHPEQFDTMLPDPKDKTFQSWLAWRATLAG